MSPDTPAAPDPRDEDIAELARLLEIVVIRCALEIGAGVAGQVTKRLCNLQLRANGRAHA